MLKLFRKNKKKEIARILNREAVSLQEYLLIFPDACPKCGSRDWTKIFWVVNSPSIASSSFSKKIEQSNTYNRCIYCGYTNSIFCNFLETENSVQEWYLEVKKTYYRVNSPYLEEEQENLVLDWTLKVQ